MMNTRTKLLMITLAAIPAVAVAEEEQKLSCIKDVTYSQEFLARWPNVGAACHEVVVKDGEKWVRFTSRIAGVREGKHVAVEILNVSGDPLGTVTFAPAADTTVVMNGKAIKATSLKKGDKLDFWFPATRLDYYYATTPGASVMQAWPVVSVVRAPGR